MDILKFFVAPFLTLCMMTSCGGGGGDSFVGGANVDLSVTPNTIDTGDRVLVRVNISNIHPDGVSVKFNYPTSLTYIPNSGAFESSSQDEFDVDPVVNQNIDDETYLVFFLSDDDVEQGSSATITFELEAVDTEDDAVIGVDADVNDISVDDALEFDIENPEYMSEDQESVNII